MLDIALKEWSVVSQLLMKGDLGLLIRKGGIHESGGPGVFELEYPRFGLFPSWAHQKPEMMKPQYRNQVEVKEEPTEIPISGMGVVERIWQIPSRQAFDTLNDLHCWDKPQIDMRFDYKPDRPLYLMAVRGYTLKNTLTVPNHSEYSGCRSWVPLRPEHGIDESEAIPGMSDDDFGKIIQRVDQAFGQ